MAGSQRQTPMRAHGTKHHRLRRAPHPIFTLSGRHRRDIDDSYDAVVAKLPKKQRPAGA